MSTLVSLMLLGNPPSSAHGVSTSYTTITLTSTSARLTFAFELTDAIVHFHLDANGDHVISNDELQAALPRLAGFITAHTRCLADGVSLHLEQPHGTLTRLASGQEFVELDLTATLTNKPQRLSIILDPQYFETLGQQFTMLAKVVADHDAQQTVLSMSHLRQDFSISHAPDLPTQLGAFFLLGIKHIFFGYDHILFLLALIIIGGRLISLVKIITAFTVAHSMTLILAALQIISLPPRLIESAIALSIAYVAAENWVTNDIEHRWIITFFFGLVHGFGFANALRDLGLPTNGLVASLLAFNVGVEIGQLGIVAVLLPVIRWIAKQRCYRQVVVSVSAVVFLLGLAWFVERAFGLAFMPF